MTWSGQRQGVTNTWVIDEAMMLESQIYTLSPPGPRTLKTFKRWFLSAAPIPVLWGRDAALFDNEQDLVTLASVDADRLNIFLKAYFGWFFKVSRDSEKASQDIYVERGTDSSLGKSAQ